ncbi:MAG: hypothetical protein FWF50_05350 [Defluviitaleaceae bacterium]|nr:hypothetical protein [Defluviitaleaceae bacterium]
MTKQENLQYTSFIRAMYILGHDDIADKILNSDEEEIKKFLEELKQKYKGVQLHGDDKQPI